MNRAAITIATLIVCTQAVDLDTRLDAKPTGKPGGPGGPNNMPTYYPNGIAGTFSFSIVATVRDKFQICAWN